jgi:hypothetical protein
LFPLVLAPPALPPPPPLLLLLLWLLQVAAAFVTFCRFWGLAAASQSVLLYGTILFD